MDYMVYAYLQGAQNSEAKRILEELPNVSARLKDGDHRYAVGAIPARYSLENRKWNEAATLVVPTDVFRGGSSCWTEASLHFARGLGAVHTGELAEARRSIAQLQQCTEVLLNSVESNGDQADAARLNNELWVNLVDAQRLGQKCFAARRREEPTRLGLVRPGEGEVEAVVDADDVGARCGHESEVSA